MGGDVGGLFPDSLILTFALNWDLCIVDRPVILHFIVYRRNILVWVGHVTQ